MYLALFSGDPASGGRELTGGAYERALVEASEGAFRAAFPTATADWPPISYCALFAEHEGGAFVQACQDLLREYRLIAGDTFIVSIFADSDLQERLAVA